MDNIEGNIDNLQEFSDMLREFVFEKSKTNIALMLNIKLSELEPSENYASKKECELIVSEMTKKIPKPYSQEIVLEICNALKKRIFSNILSKLAADGLIDCAYSEESDDFVFKTTEKGMEKGITIPQRP